MEGGLDFAVKYPFSQTAKETIKELELTERIVELGTERLRKALKGDSSARVVFHESDKKEEIGSFAAARMILSALRNHFITNRFAVNESKRVRSFLDKDTEEMVDRVGSEFGIKTVKERGMLLDLPSYLKNCPRSLDYKLINRRIFNGRVEIKAAEKKRLIEEAVKKHIEDVPLIRDPPDMIKQAGEKLLQELPKNEARITINAEDHPPCITKLLEEAKKHQNLPHHARWYLASYMLSIGISEDELAGIFANMPDYNEKTTRYQISHINKKRYSVPSCSTVMTYGLCLAVCRIGNPLNWHRLTKQRKEAINK